MNLDRDIVLKAKILAARRGTSISALLGEQIEALVGTDEAYERAKLRAFELFEHGSPLGGSRDAPRDALHDR